MGTTSNTWDDATIRRYNVIGEITFLFTEPSFDRSLGFFRELILAVDQQFPWSDETKYDGKGKSIRELSAGFNLSPTNNISFTLHPPFAMHQAQLHAYEKYLMKLAEELAARCRCNGAIAKEVQSHIKITSKGRSFSVQTLSQFTSSDR
jgi:hypothetical protein